MVVHLLCLRVSDCDVSEWLDLPALESVQVGQNAFCETLSLELTSILIHDEWRLDLPELTSIQMGHNAFKFIDDESTELIMRGYSYRMSWLTRLAQTQHTHNNQ